MLKQIAICVGDRMEAQYALDAGQFVHKTKKLSTVIVLSTKIKESVLRQFEGSWGKNGERTPHIRSK